MSLKNIQVLVVDDFKTMRSIITAVLKQLGVTKIAEAENGHRAYAILAKARFDLVISDWNMPVMTGFELVKKMREHEQYKKIPVVMLTAESDKKSVGSAIGESVSDYIAKPFTPDLLSKRLQRHLKKIVLQKGVC